MVESGLNRIQLARALLQAAREEFARAEEAKGGAAVIGLRNSCGKGWLATLEALNAYFLNQGVSEGELPDDDRGKKLLYGPVYGPRYAKGLYCHAANVSHRRLLRRDR